MWGENATELICPAGVHDTGVSVPTEVLLDTCYLPLLRCKVAVSPLINSKQLEGGFSEVTEYPVSPSSYLTSVNISGPLVSS